MIVTPQLLSQDRSQVFCSAWKTGGCCFASTARDLQVRSDSSGFGDESSDCSVDSSAESSDSCGRSSDSDTESSDSDSESSDSNGQSMVCFPWYLPLDLGFFLSSKLLVSGLVSGTQCNPSFLSIPLTLLLLR